MKNYNKLALFILDTLAIIITTALIVRGNYLATAMFWIGCSITAFYSVLKK